MMLPLYQILRCDFPGGCDEELEVRIYNAPRLLSEVEQGLEENGWALEEDGHKCSRHKYETGRAA